MDGILEDLLPRLSKGDIVIDGGNEWWADTEKRQRKAGEKGIKWVGMGVSGGCELPSLQSFFTKSPERWAILSRAPEEFLLI